MELQVRVALELRSDWNVFKRINHPLPNRFRVAPWPRQRQDIVRPLLCSTNLGFFNWPNRHSLAIYPSQHWRCNEFGVGHLYRSPERRLSFPFLGKWNSIFDFGCLPPSERSQNGIHLCTDQLGRRFPPRDAATEERRSNRFVARKWNAPRQWRPSPSSFHGMAWRRGPSIVKNSLEEFSCCFSHFDGKIELKRRKL